MRNFLAILFTASSLLILGCGAEKANAPAPTVELHIAAAASLTDAMKDLAEIYQQEHPEVKLTFNFGSSGALQQAIENGGETDLFFSAAKKQMDALEKSDNLEEGTRKDLLENAIVLIIPQEGCPSLNNFNDLNRSELKHIALGEPKGVPVGQYTEEILSHLGLWEQVQKKAVYGSDVRQVLAWVAAGEADCGIVYATDAAIEPKVKVVAQAPQGSHTPIIYPAAVIKSSKHIDEARTFLRFAESEKAKNIFAKYGFICH